MGGHFIMKSSIFIDGNNFYHGLKYIYKDSRKFMDFNFEKFCDFLANENQIINIFYYNASLDRNENKKASIGIKHASKSAEERKSLLS